MIGNSMYTTILTLWKQGMSKSEISRTTGHSRKAIRRIVNKYEQEGKESPSSKVRSSKLQKYEEVIKDLLDKDLSSVRIHQELQNLGNKISYPSVVRAVRNMKGNKKICIRFHTKPGEEAQVDFGYIGLLKINDIKKKKAYIFNMRLSYSRLDYFEIVFDQKVETFIRCHINAFKYFGGVPEVVKIDNLKAAILNANFYEPLYQNSYKSFADHYGFNPVPCRVRKPQEKGKVESGIKYVKGNFFAGREYKFEKLREELRYWLDNECNKRIHGTTKLIPRESFELEEKNSLKSLPEREFHLISLGTRKVQNDCHITFENNYYSVPHKYVGMEIEVENTGNLLKLYHQGEPIATHNICTSKGQFITENSHYPEKKLFTPGSTEFNEYYRNKLLEIGESASKIYEILIIERPYDWHRTAKGIVKLSNSYSKQVVNAACKRALEFNVLLYSKIKSICKSGSYNLSIEEEGTYGNN